MERKTLRLFLLQHWGDFSVLLLWSVISLALLAHHEPWRDEIHAWGIAHDLDLVSLFHYMRYEGHVLLWFVFLKFLPCFPNTTVLLLASWILCFAGTVLWLFHAPFDKWFRWVLPFTVPFLYWFPVVSRCYALLPLLLFAIATLYPHRWEHPWWHGVLVALLANTHLVAEGIVLSLFLFDLYEVWQARRDGISGWCRRVLAPALTLLGVLFAFLTVIRSVFYSGWSSTQVPKLKCLGDNALFFGSHIVGFASLSHQLWMPAILLALFLLVYVLGAVRRRATSLKGASIVVVCASVSLAATAFAFLHNWRFWWLLPAYPVAFILLYFPGCTMRYVIGMSLSFGWLLLLVYICVPFLPQRSFLVLLYAVFFAWIKERPHHTSADSVALSAHSGFVLHALPILVFALFSSISTGYNDWKCRFSDLEHCANFIKRSIPKDMPLAQLIMDASVPHLYVFTQRPLRVYQYGIELRYDPGNLRRRFPSRSFEEMACQALVQRSALILQAQAGKGLADMLISRCGYRCVYQSPPDVITDDVFIILLPP